MSWRKPTLAIALALALAAPVQGCGFRPLYGQASRDSAGYSTEARLSAIEIAPIANRLGQQVHNYLRDAINPSGRPDTPAYRLEVVLVESNPGGLTRRDLGASRTNVALRAYFTLYDATDNPLLQDSAKATTGFDVFRDPLNDISAEEDAQERASRLLAQLIAARLAAYFSLAQAD